MYGGWAFRFPGFRLNNSLPTELSAVEALVKLSGRFVSADCAESSLHLLALYCIVTVLLTPAPLTVTAGVGCVFVCVAFSSGTRFSRRKCCLYLVLARFLIPPELDMFHSCQF